MVTISTQKHLVSGQYIIFKVNYSANNHQFSIALPDKIATAIGYRQEFISENPKLITGATQGEVENQLEKILYQFSKTVTKEEKVIIVKMEPGFKLHEGRHCVHGGSPDSKINPDDVTYHHELSLSLQFYVVIKKTFNEREVYFTLDYRENKSQPMIGSGSYNGWTAEKEMFERYDGFFELPWTQEREDFFRSAQLGFIGLINKLIEFRNTAKSDSTKVLTFIDNGGNFGLALPAGKEEK